MEATQFFSVNLSKSWQQMKTNEDVFLEHCSPAQVPSSPPVLSSPLEPGLFHSDVYSSAAYYSSHKGHNSHPLC